MSDFKKKGGGGGGAQQCRFPIACGHLKYNTILMLYPITIYVTVIQDIEQFTGVM